MALRWPRLFFRGAYDIGKLEELAARMGKAASLEHGTRVAAFAIELVVSAKGIGLQYPGPRREMGLRVLAASVARVVEQGSWWIRSGEGAIIAHVSAMDPMHACERRPQPSRRRASTAPQSTPSARRTSRGACQRQ